MQERNAIGVVGGMGPYAGLDLVKKIFDQIPATRDQDHLPVAMISYPARIPDRSAFLFRESDEDPSVSLTEIVLQLEQIGASVAGIPCNTAHAPRILDPILETLVREGWRIRIVHMIEETVRYISEQCRDVQHVGVLSTTAVFRLRLYANALEAAGFTAVRPDEPVQENIVNRAIFDADYGIKAKGNPVSEIARQGVLSAIAHLKTKGAEAVILGCTELPLAVPEPSIDGVLLIDPTVVLARALIRETFPERLSG